MLENMIKNIFGTAYRKKVEKKMQIYAEIVINVAREDVVREDVYYRASPALIAFAPNMELISSIWLQRAMSSLHVKHTSLLDKTASRGL